MKQIFFLWSLAFSLGGLGALPPFLVPLLETPSFQKGVVPYSYPLETDLIALFSSTYTRHAHKFWKPKNEALAKVLQTNAVAGAADAELIELVYRDLVENAVAKEQNAPQFDPKGDLGFCFGRALWVHHLLRKKQITQADIAKLFVVGKLNYRDLMWDFHVATLVRGKDKTWWAIDSLYEKPLPAAEWMTRAEKLGANKKRPELFFALTDPRKFQAGHGSYQVEALKNSSLYGYFQGLFGKF